MTEKNEIFVLTARPSEIGDETWPRLSALLDDSERQRAARFVFDRDRQGFIAAHALKRLMFAVETGVAATAWKFETAPGGKPYALPQNGTPPFFNLSHCDGLVACALSRTEPSGIDVECSDRHAPFAVAERHYAPEEQAWLATLPEAERQTGFFMLWTLKEAFIKATGKGLAQPLPDIIVRFDPLRVHFNDTLAAAFGDPTNWHFEQSQIAPRHLFALAWRGPARVMSRTIRLNWLLERATENPPGLAAIVAE
jgi:4'-phosphopantetheinyl transferase